MRKEQVPLRHFNALPTWPPAMSRLNLISTGTATKNKGNRREQPLSISHPFHSSFPPSLLSPFLLLLLKSTIKNTMSYLKHSPRVKLDWKPLLKEITSGVEFCFYSQHKEPKGSEGGLVAMPTAEAVSLAQSPGARSSESQRREAFAVNPGVDGQGYIPSQQVQGLGRSPATRDPL